MSTRSPGDINLIPSSSMSHDDDDRRGLQNKTGTAIRNSGPPLGQQHIRLATAAMSNSSSTLVPGSTNRPGHGVGRHPSTQLATSNPVLKSMSRRVAPVEPSPFRGSSSPTSHGMAKKGGSSKPTGSTGSPSLKNGGGNNLATPSRVRFAQSTGNNSNPSRPSQMVSKKKSSSHPPQHSHQSHPHQSSPLIRTPNISATKSSKSLSPLWQQLDDDFEERLLSLKRDRTGSMAGFARRTTLNRRAADIGAEVVRLDVNDPDHVVAQIAPVLRLRVADQDVDSDDDEPRYRPQPRRTNVKVEGSAQRAVKASAARKLQSVDASSSDEGTSKSSSEETVNQEDELDPDQYDANPSESEDVTMEDVDQDSYQKSVVFDEQKMITAPLPDSNDVELDDDIAIIETAHQRGPSADLIHAVEALSLSNIRMRKTRRLPFLLRKLREGFLKRCRNLLVPIYSDDLDIHLQVHYESAGGDIYQVEVNKWMCPLCDLFGVLETREMLNCHLRWDHPEVYYDWQDLELPEIHSWRLQLVIQEPDLAPQRISSRGVPEAGDTRSTASDFEVKVRQTPEPQNLSGIFPSVSLSPSSARPTPRRSTPGNVQVKREEIEASLEPQSQQISPVLSRRSTTAGSTSQAGPSIGTTSRSLSHTGTSDTATSSSTARRLRSPTSRFPTPPPQEDPLGPAAQPPYLPADYGGNMVLYSCRPGGPCLFDLLGTLPMEPFGLLDWEVLDREDEIYESDDVKEEYKVMHALWARWIILNRNKFIANYAKGVKAFVDEYWTMIHWAAGWDALRYFLFIFLANQFLTGREVAQTLTHYESLTGMTSWYD